jgi:hypothetical protein
MQKPAHLDRDQIIPLDTDVAQQFAKHVSNVLMSEGLTPFLSERHLQEIAAIITNLPDFPYDASLHNGKLKTVFVENDGYKLKTLSDGVNDLYKSIIRNFRENDIMPEREQLFTGILSSAFQPALLEAYSSSGMPEGPHTGYINRGC